jgi:hypothetical protein
MEVFGLPGRHFHSTRVILATEWHMRVDFREAQGPHELKRLLQLRRHAYRHSPFSALLEDDAAFGRHDAVSHHYGLFEPLSGLPVAYLRITPFSASAQPALPIFQHSVPADLVAAVANLARGSRVVEGTRLSVIPGERSRGWATRIVDAAIAVHRVAANDLTLLVCKRSHCAFYRRRGFDVPFRTQGFRIAGTPVSVAVGPYYQSGPRLERLAQMAHQFSSHGRICFDDSSAHGFPFGAPAQRPTMEGSGGTRIG